MSELFGTLREALRRLLWTLPVLVFVSAVSFWWLSRWQASEAEGDAAALPVFFNPNPRDVHDRARLALEQLRRGRSEPAARELVQLGGAALPHVLPNLDTLTPAARSELAMALGPVARRMRVGTEEELNDPERAVLFWSQYWQTRSIDFRAAVVRRLVRRLAERPSKLRREDIVQLDTYALPYLVQAMGRVKTAKDVARVQRLTSVAAHAADKPWTISDSASPAEAAAVVEQWQRWWIAHRSRFVTFDGAARLAAMLTETRYGRWTTEAVRTRLGSTREGVAVLDLLRGRGSITLLLLGLSLVGGYFSGIATGMWSAVVRRPAELAITAVAVALASLPPTLVHVFSSFGSNVWLAGLVTAAVTAALVSRYQRAASRRFASQGPAQALRALGASPLRVALRSVRSSSVASLSLLGAQLPTLVTLVFVAEAAFGLRGLASVTVQAVEHRDISWLMALVVLTTLAVALAQIASDALLELTDHRIAIGPRRREERP